MNEEYIVQESVDTQCNMISAHLHKGLTLTSLEALKLFGCMRLASRIHDLRVRGENIIVEKKRMPNGKFVAQYRLAV